MRLAIEISPVEFFVSLVLIYLKPRAAQYFLQFLQIHPQIDLTGQVLRVYA